MAVSQKIHILHFDVMVNHNRQCRPPRNYDRHRIL